MATWEALRAEYGNAIIDILPPWMSGADLASAYLHEMIDVQGDSPAAAENALEALRNAPQYQEMYDSYFAGNRREDGSLRLAEGVYLSTKQGFRDALLAVSPNMDPSIFENEYSELIAGDVQPDEFYQRVQALQTEVLGDSAFIRDVYAQRFGFDMTDEGILASLMSPAMSNAILNKNITMAQVGGEASMRNFDITNDFVDILVNEGQMDREEANRMFGSAAVMLPALGAMAQRHADPDDTFDITEFAQAATLNDPTQLARMDRLVSQEGAQFTGGAQLEYVRNQSGGVVGLAERQ